MEALFHSAAHAPAKSTWQCSPSEEADPGSPLHHFWASPVGHPRALANGPALAVPHPQRLQLPQGRVALGNVIFGDILTTSYRNCDVPCLSRGGLVRSRFVCWRPQWYSLSGIAAVVWPDWYCRSGMAGMVLPQWYSRSGMAELV